LLQIKALLMLSIATQSDFWMEMQELSALQRPFSIKGVQWKNGNPEGQFSFACIADHADLTTTVRSDERCCDLSPAGAACLGWCFQAGCGFPVYVTAAA
jgi:hypothetical protein